MKRLLFTGMIVIVLVFNLKAQVKTPVRDTIYYFLDTAKIPVNDRIWDIGEEGPFKYYTFQCECLKYNSAPTFIYNLDKQGELINSAEMKKKHFISTVNLLKLIKENDGESFNHKHIAYFIEPFKKRYIKHIVRLIAPRKREPSIDYEIIKPNSDTLTKHH